MFGRWAEVCALFLICLDVFTAQVSKCVKFVSKRMQRFISRLIYKLFWTYRRILLLYIFQVGWKQNGVDLVDDPIDADVVAVRHVSLVDEDVALKVSGKIKNLRHSKCVPVFPLCNIAVTCTLCANVHYHICSWHKWSMRLLMDVCHTEFHRKLRQK